MYVRVVGGGRGREEGRVRPEGQSGVQATATSVAHADLVAME